MLHAVASAESLGQHQPAAEDHLRVQLAARDGQSGVSLVITRFLNMMANLR